MLPIRNRLSTTLNLSDQQVTRAIKVGLSVIVTVIAPTVALCGLLLFTIKDHYLTAFMAVLVANIVIRYHQRLRQGIKAHRERVGNIQRVRTELRHNKMFHRVEASLFTRRWSGLSDEQLLGQTYIDDTQHWVVAVRLFFNPFAEHGEKIPDGKTAASIYLFFRTLAEYTWAVWLGGWLVTIGLIAYEVFFASLPQFSEYVSAAAFWSIVAVVVMTVWTVGWVSYVVWLFQRDRLTVTRDSYVVTSRRLPFQDIENRRGEMKEFQSVVLKTTLLGLVLGYAHIEIQSWHEPEPIPGRRFVKHPERLKVVMERLAGQGHSKTIRPPARLMTAIADSEDDTVELPLMSEDLQP